MRDLRTDSQRLCRLKVDANCNEKICVGAFQLFQFHSPQSSFLTYKFHFDNSASKQHFSRTRLCIFRQQYYSMATSMEAQNKYVLEVYRMMPCARKLGGNGQSMYTLVLVKAGYGAFCAICGPLAQLAEQLTLNQRVRGSSPWWVTYRVCYQR